MGDKSRFVPRFWIWNDKIGTPCLLVEPGTVDIEFGVTYLVALNIPFVY